MNICVVAQPSSWYVKDLQRAAEKQGDQILVVGFSEITGCVGQAPSKLGKHPVDQIDLVLVRSMPPGSLEQVVFRMNAIQQFASQSGVPVVNDPRSMEVAIDKYLCLCKLKSAGLPVPKTLVAEKAEQAMEHFISLGSNVVVKPIFGGEGRGVMRVENEDLAWRTFKTIQRSQSIIYQQEFIASSDGDIRILMIGDQEYAMRRFNPTDWRSNMSRGATAETHRPNESQRQLARQAIDACGCEIAGVDLMVTKDRQDIVIEVNAVPGWKALGQCLEIDIAKQILNYCRKKIRK